MRPFDSDSYIRLSHLLKLPQEEVKELRAFQKQTVSFEESLRREVINKVDVFLEHAARFIMSTPEASLFTDSLAELH